MAAPKQGNGRATNWIMGISALAIAGFGGASWHTLQNIHGEQMRSAEARGKMEEKQVNVVSELTALKGALEKVVANQTAMDKNLGQVLTYLRGTLPNPEAAPPPKQLPFPSR